MTRVISAHGMALAIRPDMMKASWRIKLIAAIAPGALGCMLFAAAVSAEDLPDAARGPAQRALALEKIVIAGNSHVSDEAILGTVRLASGDTVDAAILEDARLRLLHEHQLLSVVEFSTRPGSRLGFVILDVAITERRPVSFETGFGYHDIYGWFLTLLGVRIDPGFAGGTELALGLRLGYHLAGLDGRIERRGARGGFGFGGDFHIYSEKHLFFVDDAESDDGSVRELQQGIERSGAELYLLHGARERTRFSFGLRLESVRPESSFVDPANDTEYPLADFPAPLQTEIEDALITGLFFRIVRDTRDRLDYPRSGSFSMLQMQSNNTYLGGDEIYAKAELDFRKHIGLGGWRVLSSKLSAGVASTGAPYYERFFIGGIYSIRGFQELSLSPPSGHTGFAIASEELRVPLVTSAGNVPRLTGIVFIDAGFGWQHGTALDASDIQAAAGYGLRLRLPWIGTLGVDAGIPFTDGRTGDRFVVHGSLGFSF